MKTRITLLERNLQVSYIVLIGIVCISSIAFCDVHAQMRRASRNEPIGTIGQPYPEQHVFLSNEVILRVVPTHIQIVDVNTGVVIYEFGERTYISDVVFSPTAAHLAILNYSVDSGTTTVNVWDVNAREQISEWEIAGRIRVVAFSPTEPLFAASFDDEIHLWNWQIGKLVGTMKGERRPWEQCHSQKNRGRRCSGSPRDHALVFSPDGRSLIVASTRPGIELWNVETRRLEGHFEGHTGNWVEHVVISPDGTLIATFEYGSNVVYVWDVKTQHLLWKEQSGIGSVAECVFSPDSKRLYVATATSTYALSPSGDGTWEGWDDQVRVWDVKSGQQIESYGSEFCHLETIALSPDGKTALLHYWDAVVLWNIETNLQRNVWADFVNEWDEALSADGQTLVSVSECFIKIWDIPSQHKRLLISAEGGLFRRFAISPDGQKLAVGRDAWIEVRNLQTGKVETKFPYSYGHSDIAFSSSGRWIAAASGGKDILIFDLEDPEKIQRVTPDVELSSTSIRRIAFSENDEHLAASHYKDNNNHRMLLWKREGDTFVFQYAWQVSVYHSSSNARLTFASPVEGSAVLAVPGHHDIQIWKLMADRPQLVTTLDASPPVHFSTDGRYLFANRGYHLQIWDWQAEMPLEHPSIPAYFDISQDRCVLMSYTETGQIQIWDGTKLLPSKALPTAIELRGKQIVILGEVKRNQLLQNFPNPFNPETWIPFQLANESRVTIHIHSPPGQLVRQLSPGTVPPGDYSSQSQAVYWDGCNQAGEPVSSGVYFYTINAGDFSATRKMLIRK